MKMFSINFPKLAILLLPTLLRKPVVIAILQAALNPLIGMYNKYTAPGGIREKNRYRLRHTGQVCYVRKALNDAFWRTREDGFEIKDAEIAGDWLVTYDESNYRKELIPILDDNTYLKISDESAINGLSGDFYVRYPDGLTEDEKKRMRTLVNQYKLVSRKPIYKVKQL